MKKRLLCPTFPKPNLSVSLSDGEAHHAIHVLRLSDQDIVEILDGNGHRGHAKLRTRGGPVRVEWIPEQSGTDAAAPFKDSLLPVTLEMAVLKGNAMEWTVEKAVELGIGQLVPVLTAHTVVQIKNKGPAFYQDRWQKIADQALKQCGRTRGLKVLPPAPLENLIMDSQANPSFVRLWCDEKNDKSSSYLFDWLQSNISLPYSEIKILVGPEGGWSSAERLLLIRELASNPIQQIDLGPLVLRAETAAIFSMSLVTSFLRCNRSDDAESLAKNSSFL